MKIILEKLSGNFRVWGNLNLKNAWKIHF